MYPKVKTKISVEQVDFFSGSAVEIIEKIRAIQDAQPEGVVVEIEPEYYGYDGGADIVFNAVREMNEEEKQSYALNVYNEKVRKDKKEKDARAKKILSKKSKGEKISEKDKKFIENYMK